MRHRQHDARAVDERFAADLERSKAGKVPPHKGAIKVAPTPLAVIPAVPAAEPSAGGQPFAQIAKVVAPPRSRLKVALAVAGGTAALGGIGYGIYRATRGAGGV